MIEKYKNLLYTILRMETRWGPSNGMTVMNDSKRSHQISTSIAMIIL